MAIVHLTTTSGAVPPEERAPLAAALAAPTCEVEAFAGSAMVPALCWTFFDEQPRRAVSTRAGDPARPLCSVTITILAGAINGPGKRALGADVASAVLRRENRAPVPKTGTASGCASSASMTAT